MVKSLKLIKHHIVEAMKYSPKFLIVSFLQRISFILLTMLLLLLLVSPGWASGTIKWTFPTGQKCPSIGVAERASPAIGSDGTVYIGASTVLVEQPYPSTTYCTDVDYNLYAIRPDGSQKWVFNDLQTRYSEWPSSPSIGADGTIYFGYAQNLYAINPDGTQKWTFLFPNEISHDSPPVIGINGTIYIAVQNELYAINPDGTKKWIFTTQGGHITSSAAIGTDGTIYVRSYDYNLYAINPDGSSKWTLYLDNCTGNSSPAIGPDGTIYIGGRYFYAVNSNGTIKWEYTGEPPNYNNFSFGEDSSPAIGPNGIIYKRDFYQLFAINPDGTTRWTYFLGGIGGDNDASSPAIGADGTIYIGTNTDFLAINPNGTLQWSLQQGGFMNSSPAIAPDGTIYVSSDNEYGSLFAINSDSIGLSNSSWPMLCHDALHTGNVAGVSGSISPVNAHFSVSQTRGAPPLVVNFTDHSTGSINSWDWSFGDGSSSNEQNPSHTYNDLGSYTVTLYVTGPEGSDTETKTDYINVGNVAKAMPWIPLLLLNK